MSTSNKSFTFTSTYKTLEVISGGGNITYGGGVLNLGVEPNKLTAVLLTNDVRLGLYKGTVKDTHISSGSYVVKRISETEKIKLIVGIYKEEEGVDEVIQILYAGDFSSDKTIIIPSYFGENHKLKLYAWYDFNKGPYTEHVVYDN